MEGIFKSAEALKLGPEDIAAVASVAARSPGGAAGGKALMAAAGKIPELKEKNLLQDSPDFQGYLQQIDQLRESNPTQYNDVMKGLGPKAGGVVSFAASHPEIYNNAKKSALDYETGRPLNEINSALEASPDIARMQSIDSAEAATKTEALRASDQKKQQAYRTSQAEKGLEIYRNSDQGSGWWDRFGQEAEYQVSKRLIGLGGADTALGKKYATIGEQAGTAAANRAPTTTPSNGMPTGKDEQELAKHLENAAAAARNLSSSRGRDVRPMQSVPGILGPQ